MKKMLAKILCLALALCLMCGSALAVDATLAKAGANTYGNLISITAAGDILYCLKENDNGTFLYWWQEGMDDAEAVDKALINPDQASTQEELQEMHPDEDTTHATKVLFSDGTRLMGMNGLSGLVFEIKVEDGQLSYTDLLTLKDLTPLYHMEEDYQYMANIKGIAVSGDTLAFVVQDWDEQGYSTSHLVLCSLTDGSVRTSGVEFITAATSYQDGKLLVLIFDERNAYDNEAGTMKKPTLAVYDIATDTVEEKGDLVVESNYSNVEYMVYSAEMDTLFYMDGSKIVGMKGLGEAKQYGYAPVDYLSICPALLKDSFVVGDYRGVYVRTVSENFASDEYLNVYGNYMDEGTMAFSAKYPAVPVYNTKYYDDIEKLSQAMVSGGDSLDVLRMKVAYSSFTTLRDKGYCADLSADPVLVDYVERLYPAFKDILMKDGKLVAIPVGVYGSGYAVSGNVLEGTGMTLEELPTNLVELCQFITRWNNEMTEDYPNYTVLDWCNDHKAYMFQKVMEQYMQYCNAKGEAISFSTPMFRELMTAVEAMECDELDRMGEESMLDGEDYVYREGLLYDSTVVGNFSLMDGRYDNQYLPVTLTADADMVIPVNLEVMFINPKTTHMNSALNLLHCIVENLASSDAYSLLSDKTEPVDNASYEDMKKSAQQWIDEVNEQMKTADEADMKELQSSLEQANTYMAYVEKVRYDISEECIRVYQEQVIPYISIALPTFMNASKDDSTTELNTLMSRYQEGQISLDQFIREADGKMRMMQLENE